MKRQKRLQDNREKIKQEKIDIRRIIIIGKMVIKYFPQLLIFQPRRTVKENESEFEVLENLLFELAADKEYLEQLKQKVAAEISSET